MSLKLYRFEFSLTRYWLVLIFLAAVLLWRTFSADFSGALGLFIIFGLAGIAGETLVSIWWHHFFGQRFWTYLEDAIYHKYTSTLNFIPWAICGFVYFYIIKLVVGGVGVDFPGLGKISAGVFLASLAAQVIIFNLFLKNHKFHKLTAGNVIFFYFPILLTLIVLWQIYGNKILWLGLLFGIILSVLEYLFGKFMQLFLTKKLWLYNYAAVDRGHFTPLSIPFFALAGFYFWIIIRIIG